MFCESFLGIIEDDESVLNRVIWSDEATFKLNGHVNRYNSVYWDSKNPKITIDREVNAPGITVWAGIWSEGIVGPFFFENSVDGKAYLDMLQNEFWPRMEEAVEQQQLFFMQDGAPPHWAKVVRDWLNEKFPDRWIGRGGAIAWPPRSPDLTPPDFFLWGVLRDKVYKTKPHSVNELKEAILREIAEIPIDLCQKVCESVTRRLEKCIEVDGQQIEHFD